MERRKGLGSKEGRDKDGKKEGVRMERRKG